MSSEFDPEILADTKTQVNRLRDDIRATGSAAEQLRNASGSLASAASRMASTADAVTEAKTTLEGLRQDIQGLDATKLLAELADMRSIIGVVSRTVDSVRESVETSSAAVLERMAEEAQRRDLEQARLEKAMRAELATVTAAANAAQKTSRNALVFSILAAVGSIAVLVALLSR